jgi:hypothetical protein
MSETLSPVAAGRLSERPTSPLYHYTTADGLRGIVEKKLLWASDVQCFFNDTAEYKYAASVVRDLLKEYLDEGLVATEDLYKYLLKILPFCTDARVFAGSFSEAEDKLSQWRGYCPNGGGFSVGFAPDLIERQAKKQGFELLKCEYDQTKQRALCKKLIDDGRTAAKAARNQAELRVSPAQTEAEKKLAPWVAEGVATYSNFLEPLRDIRVSAAIKHPCFSEECEWRVVRGPFVREEVVPGVKFRAGKYTVIPYLEFALAETGEPLELEKVIIGPNPDPEQTHKSVECLLKSLGVRYKEIREWSGTYRNL